MSTEHKRTFCRVCEPSCGMIATVEDGRLTALAPDREHPVTKGFVCHKGIYGLDIHNDPDRLNVPLRRTAPGKFEEISWDEALDGIAGTLQRIIGRHGARAVSGYRGNPSAFNALFGPAWGSFFAGLGDVRMFSSGTQDAANKFAGGEATFGSRSIHTIPDIAHADFLLIFGENPAVSHMTFISIADPVGALREAEARGARIIYVNPRTIESARFAGTVQHIRPDTDVYLMAAMLHEIDRTVGFDAEAVARHGRNVDELRTFVARYPAEKVAGITGIDAETIKALARDYASAPRAGIHIATGVNMGRQGTIGYWLMNVLALVTGNLGRRGGNVFSPGFYTRSAAAGRGSTEVADYLETPFGTVRRPGGIGITLPGVLMADMILDPADPIRAMIVNAGNPLLSVGGEEKTHKALESLDLLVCVDIYRSPTAELAHYILPAAGAFEREDVNSLAIGLQYQPFVQYTEAVVEPAFERKPEWWIYGQLAKRMGLPSIFDDSDDPDLWGRTNAMLRSSGHSMDELRRDEIIVLEPADPESFFETVIQTEDKRVDCCPPVLADARERMAAIFRELEAEPPGQLKLITRRDGYMMNTWYANLPKMKRKGRDRNFLLMHPDDAAARQLRDGVLVHVRSSWGERDIELKFDADMMPGVVAINHGWGHTMAGGLRVARATAGVNANALLPSGPGTYEPVSNQAHMTGIAVEVSAV
jgi:anaerobic selenocysteine-containing dehydrogenase